MWVPDEVEQFQSLLLPLEDRQGLLAAFCLKLFSCKENGLFRYWISAQRQILDDSTTALEGLEHTDVVSWASKSTSF